MRISKKCEYALRALFAIARGSGGGSGSGAAAGAVALGRQFQIHDLSRQEGIPVKFLEQILLALRHAGILASKRGVGGGYQLRRAPDEISVGEIIRLMDGPLTTPEAAGLAPAGSAARALPPGGASVGRGLAPFHFLMRELHEEVAAIIDNLTLGDVLGRVPESHTALSFEI
ncbi:MAG: Rrf2 family transcriptional regulator [Verrucomicrobia bacterium]|nr:Rrf2 family transcriptional regulator [Verrucomicrobiota bacterium]MBV9657677.1 Rrf2 family transcriptional regulator [Verrucomicrobiota bacterium]